MNTKLAIPFLAVLMAVQGCIINGGGGPRDGDVTFSWTFFGQTCSTAGVASVRITIPGETLANNGLYTCESNGYPGIVLHDFYGGSYTYSVEGFDANGSLIYVGSGDFRIDGDVLETVDLTPRDGKTSYALVTWTFPGNVNCADADTPAKQLGGVKYVDITFDNDSSTTVRANCVDGSIANSGAGVYSALVDPGSHTISLTGLSASEYPLFTASSAMVTQNGTPASNQIGLQWAVGGVVVGWTLQSSTGAAQTCLGTGNPYVYVDFESSLYPQGIYGQADDANLCGAAPTRYFYLPASGATGTQYTLKVAGYSNTASWTATTAPAITVMPGVFPADTSAVNVILKQN